MKHFKIEKQDTNKWFVAYTYPRAEKKIHARIQNYGIESFLPLHKVKRKWSDRMKIVEVPLFPSYLFVNTIEKKIPQLLMIKEIVWFLSFESKLAVITEQEIEFIKKILDKGKEISVKTGMFKKGQRVVVNKGPFMGLEGLLIKEQSKTRFIIELEGLKQSLAMEIPMKYLSVKMAR